MKNLKENSIHILDAITVCWPQYGGKEETIDMTDIKSRFNNAYCINNSTICFIIDHDIFVTPYTREAMSTIVNAGLIKEYFYVPLSNWDYPEYEKAKWDHLRELAVKSYYRAYETDSAEWCDEHGIGKLSEETMKRCFRIPHSGVSVKHLGFEKTYCPVCNESCMDHTVIDKLGCYCANNGRVVFVYHDGHTYVAKGYQILDELRRAGYTEFNLFVPFSNGEQITDPYLAAEWEQIPEK